MKKIILSLAALTLWLWSSNAQNLAINADGSKPDANAILDVKSNNKGILIPRMSTAERVAIPATKGLMVYDLTTNSFWYNNGAEWKALAGGTALSSGDAWLLGGNAGTTGSNYLGTSDNTPLQIRVYNASSGRIDHILSNVFWGYGSGQMTEGEYNTGVGHEALATNQTGYSNTAVGRYALRRNIAGHSNTAVGMDALTANTVGTRNTALGMLALLSNTTGRQNTAIGFDALRSNINGGGNTAAGNDVMHRNKSGNDNTAFGTRALYSNVRGFGNTAIGAISMVETTGYDNTAVGNMAMWLGGAGFGNTAVGRYSLAVNQEGNENTAIGSGALNGTQGSYNTGIGAYASVDGDGVNNSTAIGSGAAVYVSNKVRIGNSAVTVIEGQVPFTTPSDGRYKFNVEEDVKGIDFIMQLRPVTYQFDVKRFDGNKNTAMDEAYTEAEKIRRTGFIAQEVENAAITTGYNFSGVIKPKKEGDHYSLSYDAFVVPLVKAMQEQQHVINAQNKKISDLQQQLDEIKKLLQQKK